MNNSSRGDAQRAGEPGRFQIPPSAANLVGTIPRILPHERVFPIQIGCDLFKLSGASISSDAPSYFSQYFQRQIKQAEESNQDVSSAIRTLYIDRDPVTFTDISLHLQGYHVKPRDGQHFVRLFADAQFYTLPKLMSQLYEESIFVAIGGQEFQLGRDLFQDPGNSPNFFSLGFAAFFTSPGQIFPGLERENLIRPPSIVPPGVSNRSAEVFSDIVQLLRGYPVHIRDEEHRASLLRDCRYFNFKKVEQKLIPHSISYNQARKREEIVLRVEDILKSGISILHEGLTAAALAGPLRASSSSPMTTTGPGIGSSLPGGSTHGNADNGASPILAQPEFAAWVSYARPFEDDKPYELVLEIGSESTILHTGIMRASFFGSVKARIAKLFEVIATKLNLPPTTQPLGLLMAKGGASSQPATPGNTPLSEDLVRVVIEGDAHVVLDGQVFRGFSTTGSSSGLQAQGPATTAEVDEMANALSSSSVINAHQQQQQQQDDISSSLYSRKRRRVISSTGPGGMGGYVTTTVPEDWVIRTGQWRLRIQSARNGKSAVECVLVAVKLDAYSSEQARNAQRGFLSGGVR